MIPSNRDQFECRAWWATAPLSGAIGICHLNGALNQAFSALGLKPLEVGATRLIDIAGIDEGVLATCEAHDDALRDGKDHGHREDVPIHLDAVVGQLVA